MKTSLQSFTGRSYLIVVDGDQEHLRANQPCYGELRKYERTHPGKCTQSLDHKPGDLHFPFPEGTPTSFYFDFSVNSSGGVRNEYSDKVFEAFFSEESPWVSGFKTASFERDKNGNIFGIHVPRADIDPTVLVNLLRNVRSNIAINRVNEFNKMVAHGLTPNEGLAILCNNGGLSIQNGAGQPFYYDNPKIFSARRFFEQKPNDLSGGFLSNRIDYNRKRMQDVFLGDLTTGGVTWQQHMTKHGIPQYGTTLHDLKTLVPKIKEAFEDAISNEQTPELVPYIWTTTSGQTNSVAAA